MNVETDVMVDTLMPLGITGNTPESSPETCITSPTNGANLTLSLLVTTTSTEPSNLVPQSKEPPNVLTNVERDTKNYTNKTRPSEKPLTLS
jgi:hypothetical protein